MSYMNRQGSYGFNESQPGFSNNFGDSYGPNSRNFDRPGGFSSMNNQPLTQTPPRFLNNQQPNNRDGQSYGSYSTSYPAPNSQRYSDDSGYGPSSQNAGPRDNDSRKRFFNEMNSQGNNYGYGSQPPRNQLGGNSFSGYGDQPSQRTANNFNSGPNPSPFSSNFNQDSRGNHPGSTRGRGGASSGFTRGAQGGNSRFSTPNVPQQPKFEERNFNSDRQPNTPRPTQSDRPALDSGFAKPSFEAKKPPQPTTPAVNSPKAVSSTPKPATNTPAITTSSEEPKFLGRCRLYIRNLPPSFTNPDLTELLTRFGQIRIEECSKDQGSAYVCFDYWRNAEKAKKELDNTVFKGKVVKVRHATKYTAIKVKNLSSYISNELLRDAFTQFGEVERAVVIANEQGSTTGEGIVEFTRKVGADAALKRCKENAFFLTATPQPVIVESYHDTDDIGGVADKSLPTRNTDYVKERQKRPYFAEPGTFEAAYAQKMKQLYESYQAKMDALQKEYKAEERKMLTEIETARAEHETNLLREQLRQKEIEIKEREQSSGPKQQITETTKQSQTEQNIPASQTAKEGGGISTGAETEKVEKGAGGAQTPKPEEKKDLETKASEPAKNADAQSKKTEPPKAAVRPQQKKNQTVTPAKTRGGRRGRGRPGFSPGMGRGGFNFADDIRGPMDFHMDTGNFMSFEGNFEPRFMGPSPQRGWGQGRGGPGGPGGRGWPSSPFQRSYDDSFIPNKKQRFY